MHSNEGSRQTADGYLAALHSRLAEHGFDFELGPDGILVARQIVKIKFWINPDSRRTNRFVMLSRWETLDATALGAYSTRCLEYALSPERGLPPRLTPLQTIFSSQTRARPQFYASHAMAIVEHASPELIEVARQPTPGIWWAFESRVLHDLSSGTTHFCERLPSFRMRALAKEELEFVRTCLL